VEALAGSGFFDWSARTHKKKKMADSTKELKERARKLRELARQAEKAAGGKEDVHREKMAEKSRARSRERREIEPLPPVKEPVSRAM
jgi:hypothetical protein